MKKRTLTLGSLVLFVFSGSLFSINVRLGFPHVVVGDTISTTIDVTNQGIDNFDGILSIRDDEGNFLPVLVNGVSVNTEFDLVVPSGAVVRLKITAAGEARAGHVIIHDRQEDYKTVDFNQQIDGTAIFEITDSSGQITDSIGVQGSSTAFLGSGVRQHFYFFGETGPVATGLALSNALGRRVQVTLKAKDLTGSFVDEVTITLDFLNHRAFFIDDVMDLPDNFQGTVEVEATGAIFALALRLANGQLSAVQMSAFPVVYDFTLNLFDSRQFSGEMTINCADGMVRGLARITSHEPDGDFDVSPVTGAFIPGLGVIGNFYTSFEGRVTTVMFFDYFRSSLAFDEITFPAAWVQLQGSVLGSLDLTRRSSDASAANKTFTDEDAFVAATSDNSVVGFDDLPPLSITPFSSDSVDFESLGAHPPTIRDDATNVGLPHSFFFPSGGSSPNWLDTSLGFRATFSSQVAAVGFDYNCFACDTNSDVSYLNWTLFTNGGAVTVSDYAVVDFSFDASTTRFFGLVSSVPFHSMEIFRSNTPQDFPSGRNWLVDDLRFALPE